MLLVGCGTDCSDEPRIVQMPNPAVRQTVKSPDWTKIYKAGAAAELQTFKVFNPKNQRLHLKFYPAAGRLHNGLNLKISNENTLTAQSGTQAPMELLSIHKLGPSTEEGFLMTLIGKDIFENPKCYLKQAEPNIWYLNVQIEEGDHKAVYQQLTHKADQCGPHADDWHGSPTTFFVKDGIVIVVRRAAEVFGLDVSSITYENQG